MLLLACQGPAHCQRPFRALSCRQFPFFPYITADDRFIGLAYEWEFEPSALGDQQPGVGQRDLPPRICRLRRALRRLAGGKRELCLRSEQMRAHFGCPENGAYPSCTAVAASTCSPRPASVWRAPARRTPAPFRPVPPRRLKSSRGRLDSSHGCRGLRRLYWTCTPFHKSTCLPHPARPSLWAGENRRDWSIEAQLRLISPVFDGDPPSHGFGAGRGDGVDPDFRL